MNECWSGISEKLALMMRISICRMSRHYEQKYPFTIGAQMFPFRFQLKAMSEQNTMTSKNVDRWQQLRLLFYMQSAHQIKHTKKNIYDDAMWCDARWVTCAVQRRSLLSPICHREHQATGRTSSVRFRYGFYVFTPHVWFDNSTPIRYDRNVGEHFHNAINMCAMCMHARIYFAIEWILDNEGIVWLNRVLCATHTCVAENILLSRKTQKSRCTEETISCLRLLLLFIILPK